MSELKFYSQYDEDKVIYNKFFKDNNPERGIFVELGGFDGVKWSNTKFFEDTLGWTGVLIEPIPEQFEKLKINRPNCQNINLAVSKIEGDVKFIGINEQATLKHMIPKSKQKHYEKFSEDRYYTVKSKPIYKILNDCNITYVDALFIDVEGAEQVVLDTFDWDIPVHVIAIETDKNDVERSGSIDNTLKSHGFIFVRRLSWTDV